MSPHPLVVANFVQLCEYMYPLFRQTITGAVLPVQSSGHKTRATAAEGQYNRVDALEKKTKPVSQTSYLSTRSLPFYFPPHPLTFIFPVKSYVNLSLPLSFRLFLTCFFLVFFCKFLMHSAFNRCWICRCYCCCPDHLMTYSIIIVSVKVFRVFSPLNANLFELAISIESI